jgi:parallel beta-helix repeat protein
MLFTIWLLLGWALMAHTPPISEKQCNLRNPNIIPETQSITGVSPPETGTWTISADTTVENENLLLNGSIVVNNGIQFEIINSSIEFSVDTYDLVINGRFFGRNSALKHLYRIECHGTEYIMINCSVLDIHHGLLSSCDMIRIINSTFQNCNNGLLLNYADNLYCEASDFLNIQKEAIHLESGKNATIINSTFHGTGNNYDCIGLMVQNMDNVTLRGNIYQNFYKNIYWRDSSEGYVGNSSFCQTSDSLAVDGELQFYNVENITIEHNSLHNLTNDGIEIYGSDNFLIHNNTFDQIIAGMHIGNSPSTNLTIQNNTFIDSLLVATLVNQLIIHNNSFVRGTIGIDTCTDIDIQYNDICGDPISIGTSTGIVANNNQYLCGPPPDDNGDGNQPDEEATPNPKEEDPPQTISGYPSIMLGYISIIFLSVAITLKLKEIR